ncbi:hypothetical protein PYW07_016539 [Mythimna separata]|uniref:Uncharacterized protein n=1 Tax=Mythimna separata TaxID=271217 RepID=A0AAD8DT10_MYTSE|nr:hypothetical protein PYW07_016539 [Mythimna separata]
MEVSALHVPTASDVCIRLSYCRSPRTPRRGLTSRDQDIKIDCRINFYASPHERLGNRLPEIYCQNFPLVTLTEHTPRITISQIKEPVSISSSTINYMKLG